MTDTNLAAAFGTPAKQQLAGILPPRSRTSAVDQVAPEAPVESGEVVQEPPAAPSAPTAAAHEPEPEPVPPARPAPSASAEPAVTYAPKPGEDTTTTQVSVYLLPDMLAAVRRARRGNRRTNADIALEAIDATHLRLVDLLAAKRAGPDRGPGSLFPARPRPSRAAGQGPHRVLWSMKATPAELAIIDRLVDTTGAASRSELIATAIEAYLAPRVRRRR